MKKAILAAVVLAVACAFVGGSVWAETVQGKVGKVDAAAKTITVNKANPAGGAEERVIIAVSDSTGYTGVASLDEIKEGNSVAIEAETDESGQGWNAKSVAIVTE